MCLKISNKCTAQLFWLSSHRPSQNRAAVAVTPSLSCRSTWWPLSWARPSERAATSPWRWKKVPRKDAPPFCLGRIQRCWLKQNGELWIWDKTIHNFDILCIDHQNIAEIRCLKLNVWGFKSPNCGQALCHPQKPWTTVDAESTLQSLEISDSPILSQKVCKNMSQN